jgi:hypothetical protein
VRVRGRLRWWIAVGLALALGAGAVGWFGRPTPMQAFAIADIDGYPKLTRVTACARPLVAKPGVAAFRSMILSEVGGGDDGSAVCKNIAGSGTYSDHADGRAWDWHVKASSASDRALVDQVLDWLLRTDERGNRNAMARRLGITYIIWNHRYYRVGADGAHWVPYTETGDPHDTHVHFSFSIAGAVRQTSWWTERGPLTWLLSNDPDIAVTFGEGPLHPLAGDWDGDGYDTVGAYDPASRRFSIRDTVTSGGPTMTTPPVGPFGGIPFAGNWDGIGGDEFGVYEPLARRFDFYTLAGTQARPSQVFGGPGDLPIIGDWDGNGTDDIGVYTPGSRTFSRSMPDGSVRTEVFGGAGDTPVIGDWNGDGVDDIGTFRAADNTFLLAVPTAGGTRAIRSAPYGASRRLPVIGDWDGHGTDDVGVVATG